MWWFLKKEKDDAVEIIYAYGIESKELSGKIQYIKRSDEFVILKLADDDTEKGIDFLLPLVYRIIKNEGAPAERQIAIG